MITMYRCLTHQFQIWNSARAFCVLCSVAWHPPWSVIESAQQIVDKHLPRWVPRIVFHKWARCIASVLDTHQFQIFQIWNSACAAWNVICGRTDKMDREIAFHDLFSVTCWSFLPIFATISRKCVDTRIVICGRIDKTDREIAFRDLFSVTCLSFLPIFATIPRKCVDTRIVICGRIDKTDRGRA